jgi:hypothetical protein
MCHYDVVGSRQARAKNIITREHKWK